MPMFVTGLICNVIVAIFIGKVPLVILMGMSCTAHTRRGVTNDLPVPLVIGTLFTAIANLLFAVIDVRATYWAFGFPAAIVSVFGADFVTAAGSLFVAKINPPEEQSVAGALLQTMSQVNTIVFLSTQ